MNSTRIIRIHNVIQKLSISRSTIYGKLQDRGSLSDPTFPRPVKLGSNSIGWVESEIDDWLQQRISERNSLPAQKGAL